MFKQTLVTSIFFSYGLFLLFFLFAYWSVDSFGWGLFSLLFASMASNHFVRGSNFLSIYIKIQRYRKDQDKD